ncbi:unnamed protein product [Coregonus sp. 'balchen']|nr:unnamed protein product [Coregonus sp. 'balchen']
MVGTAGEGTAPSDDPKPPLVTGKSQELISVETPEAGKRRSQPEFEAEREGPGAPGAQTGCREAPPGGPRREQGGEDRGGGSSSSSSDDGGAPPTEPHQADRDGDRPSSRPKPSPSKKYNGMKDKAAKGGGARPAGFWEILRRGLRWQPAARRRGRGRERDRQTQRLLNSPPPPGPAQSSSSGLEERESRGEGDEAGGGGLETEDHDPSEQTRSRRRGGVSRRSSPPADLTQSSTPPPPPQSPPPWGVVVVGPWSRGLETGSNRTQPSCPPLSVTPALGTTPSSDPLALGHPNPLAEEGGGGGSQ